MKLSRLLASSALVFSIMLGVQGVQAAPKEDSVSSKVKGSRFTIEVGVLYSASWFPGWTYDTKNGHLTVDDEGNYYATYPCEDVLYIYDQDGVMRQFYMITAK